MPPIASSPRIVDGTALRRPDQARRRNAIQHVAIVRDQYQRAAIFEQAFLEYLEGRNVEIIGGLVEQKYVGWLKHELRNQHASPLSAREPSDWAD